MKKGKKLSIIVSRKTSKSFFNLPLFKKPRVNLKSRIDFFLQKNTHITKINKRLSKKVKKNTQKISRIKRFSALNNK